MRAAWWWIDRWRKSTAYSDMTLAEQGAYRNLLDELWLRDGPLPNDERILAKVCGDPFEWPKVRAKVLARFRLTPEGYRNDTHDEVAAGTARAIENQRRKGRKRASEAVRGPGGRFQSDQPGQPDDQPATSRISSREPSLPSPDPSPSPEQDPDPESDGRATDQAADQPPAPFRPDLNQPDQPTDGLTDTAQGRERERRSHDNGPTETAAAIEATAAKLAELIPGVTAREWVTRCSMIPPGNGRPARSFSDPGRVSEPWRQATLDRLNEQLADVERPLPL